MNLSKNDKFQLKSYPTFLVINYIYHCPVEVNLPSAKRVANSWGKPTELGQKIMETWKD